MTAITYDDFGPFKVIEVCEPSVGLHGTLVVDNVARGASIGGLRMAPDVSTVECARLARAMTLKNAAADLPHGGGKSVLYGDPAMPKADKEQIIRAFACSLAEVEQYIFGPDMGTNEECMGWVRDEIGRAVGLPSEIGGIPLDEIGATGWGLLHAIKVACEFQSLPLCLTLSQRGGSDYRRRRRQPRYGLLPGRAGGGHTAGAESLGWQRHRLPQRRGDCHRRPGRHH